MTTNGIRVYARNPWYWEYGGEPVLLLGGSDADNIFQWAGDPDRLTAHLDTLAGAGGNYIRNTMSSRAGAFPYDDTGMAYPFRKLADGRYDLDQPDEAYWRRLTFFLEETRKRGIVVQHELWDKWAVCGGDAWAVSPWNPANNVNYTLASATFQKTPPEPKHHGCRTRAEIAHAFFAAVPALNDDPVVLGYQNRYVARMLGITLPYDHVLYQLNNESEFPPEVSNYWAAFIHEQAAGARVYVCDSRRFHPPSEVTPEFRDASNPEHGNVWAHPELYPYTDISQNGGNEGEAHYRNLVWFRAQLADAPRPINHTKTYLFTWPTTGVSWKEKHGGSAQLGAERFWRTIFGGGASCRHHRHGPKAGCHEWGGLGLTPAGQTQIRSMRMLTAELDIFRAEPRNDLLSAREENAAYAVAEPGRQYAVYFTGAGSRKVKIDLRAASGALVLKWLDIDRARWRGQEAVPGGETRELQAPDAGQWAAWIGPKR
ncbi:MAG: hypothetical protein JXR37_35195 [Kiritimatiellae bacterium]|nr:hypothetical protein [Kiritimatiellia bacterium]